MVNSPPANSEPVLANAIEALVSQARFNEAITSIDRFLESHHESPTVHNLRGMLLSRMGRLPEAIDAYRRALALDPSLPIARCNLGIVLRKSGRSDLAIVQWEQTISAAPEFLDPYIALALVWADRGALDKAESWLRRALEIDRCCADALVNLGLVLQYQERLDEAVECNRKAIEINPSLAEAYVNLGVLYHEKRMPTDACACFERALSITPTLAAAAYNLSQELLLTGELERGWHLYEARFAYLASRGHRYRSIAQPRWLGQNPRALRILLHAEQGLGDTLQFVRYAPMLAELGAIVIVECQPSLVRLLRTIEGIHHVFGRGEPLPPFDAFSPLMSLPAVFKTTLNSVPGQTPYFKPTGDLVLHWKAFLGSNERKKIGLVWAGNSRNIETDNATDRDSARLDKRRSFPPQTFAPILQTPRAQFYSLQKEASTNDISHLRSLSVHDYPMECGDFLDAAAYIQNLDLVISVDTSIAHLAGALGKPVWLLSRFDGCWRWLLDREDSPWYPTMRIFRQSKPGDWTSVIMRVRESLEAFVTETPP